MTMRAASCPLSHQFHHTSGHCKCIKSCWAIVSGYFRQFCCHIPDGIVSICFDYHHDVITLSHSSDATPFTILFAMYHCQKILLFDAWQLLSNRMQCEYLEDTSLCSSSHQRKVANDLINGLWGIAISDKVTSKNIFQQLCIVFGTFYRQNQLLSKSVPISDWSSHEIIVSLLHFLIHSESDLKNKAILWEFIECLRRYFYKSMYDGMAFLNEIKSIKCTKNYLCHHQQTTTTHSVEEKDDLHQFISYETDPFDTDNESEENEEKQVKFAKFISNIAYDYDDIPIKAPKLAYISHSEQYVKPKIRELMNLSVPTSNFCKRHSLGSNVITPVPMKLLQSKSKSFHSDLMRESSLITRADHLEYVKMGNGGNIKIGCNELFDCEQEKEEVETKRSRGMSGMELMEIFEEDLYDGHYAHHHEEESENYDNEGCDYEDHYSIMVERGKQSPSFKKDIFSVALIESFGYKKVFQILTEFDLDYSAKFIEDLSVALNEWVDSICNL